MSYSQTNVININELQSILKPQYNDKKACKTYLMPTRSNTPEEISPTSFTNDSNERYSYIGSSNSNDRDLYESNTPTSFDSLDGSGFEIE